MSVKDSLMAPIKVRLPELKYNPESYRNFSTRMLAYFSASDDTYNVIKGIFWKSNGYLDPTNREKLSPDEENKQFGQVGSLKTPSKGAGQDEKLTQAEEEDAEVIGGLKMPTGDVATALQKRFHRQSMDLLYSGPADDK